jgi:hypothetical protein
MNKDKENVLAEEVERNEEEQNITKLPYKKIGVIDIKR